MPSLSIVIPAYNEEAAIADTVARCDAAAARCTSDYEVIALDDTSKDNTLSILESLKARFPRLHVERHEKNQGIAKTFEDLYALASKDYVFLVSGDGQFPPELVERCMPLLDRADIVICNRSTKQYTLARHVISFCYRWLPRVLFGVDLYDSGSVKLVPLKVYRDIRVSSTSVFVEAERIIRAAKRGYRIAKIDFVQETRKGGKAHGGKPSTVWKAFADMWRTWWRLQVLRQAV